jgi:hypothetical protein
MSRVDGVLAEVWTERDRQDAKWGEQNHAPVVWLSILGEEFGEVCRAAYEAHFNAAPWSDYRAELVQMAAVAVAMIQCLDRGQWS